jgi:hypothetical protein
LRA